MPLDPAKLQHWIDNFYGYGSWDAPVWFIGYEEGGGADYKEVEQKLDYFDINHKNSNGPTLCDIRSLHLAVKCHAKYYDTHGELRFTGTHPNGSKLQGTWGNLIRFVKGYCGKIYDSDLEYQKTSLAFPEKGNEALIELFPLPSPNKQVWYYGWLDIKDETLRPLLKTRKSYEDSLVENRLNSIKKMADQKIESLQIMVFYGISGKVNAIKDIFKSEGKFEPFKINLSKSDSNNTRIKNIQIYKYRSIKIIICDTAPSSKKKIVDWFELGEYTKLVSFIA